MVLVTNSKPKLQASQLTTPKTKLATKLVQGINTSLLKQKLRTNMPRVCLVFEGEDLKEVSIPEEYDKDFGSVLLGKLTESLGKLPFKLYVPFDTFADKSEYVLTSGPFDPEFSFASWRKLLSLAETDDVVFVHVGLYTQVEQVSHAIRTSSSPKLAWLMQKCAGVDNFVHPDCVRALASNLKDEVFKFGLDFLRDNYACTQDRAAFVLDALDELGPTTLKPEWFDTILAWPYGLCTSLDFMLNLLSKIASLAELANKKPTDKPFGQILEVIVDKTDNKVFVDMNFLPKLAELNPCVVLRNLQADFGVSYFVTEAVFRSAMRSPFAHQHHQHIVLKISELLKLSDARLNFLRGEVEHNMKLCEFMKPQLLKRLMTPDFVARNMDNPDCPVELSATWDVNDKAFDKLLVHNAVWLDLRRFNKAPEVVQVDASLALAALQHEAVEPSSIPAQLWASDTFVSKVVELVDPCLARFATNLTPHLAEHALLAASRTIWSPEQLATYFDLVLAAFSACKDNVLASPYVVQACLLLYTKATPTKLSQAFQACNAKVIAFDWDESVRVSRQVACRFALHVDLACASSLVFANFHGDKDFVRACIANLAISGSNFDVHAFERCLGTLRDDHEVLIWLLVSLGGCARKALRLFSESIQANQVVKALLKRIEQSF